MSRPTFHETALVAFFRRHGLTAPYIDADGLIERHGLVLAMAFNMRASGFRFAPQPDGGMRIGAETFTADEFAAASEEAYDAAHLIEAILDGTHADLRGDMVDRMALIMVRRAGGDLPTVHGDLVAEGIPVGIVAEHGLEAAQLAEAMKVAVTFWRAAARNRPAAVRELEAA